MCVLTSEEGLHNCGQYKFRELKLHWLLWNTKTHMHCTVFFSWWCTIENISILMNVCESMKERLVPPSLTWPGHGRCCATRGLGWETWRSPDCQLPTAMSGHCVATSLCPCLMFHHSLHFPARWDPWDALSS